MIPVTRLDGASVVVNVDLIAWIEQTPDTVLSLVNGQKMLVREAPVEIVRRTIAYKRDIIHGPQTRWSSSGGDMASRMERM